MPDHDTISIYPSYVRPAQDGLTAWHPAYLRLGPTLEACARRYEYFCRRYKAEARAKKRSEWGGWQLWYDIAVKPAGQGDLFGGKGSAKTGARYHGGPNPKRQAFVGGGIAAGRARGSSALYRGKSAITS
jgi:putative transposase